MSSNANDSLTSITGLPGQWQYWCDAEEAGACWVVPADEQAQQVMGFSSDAPRDFMKARKAALANPTVEEEQPPPLF